MRTNIAVALGKSIFHLSRNLNKGGGSAAPGLYALKVDPNLVKKLSSKIPTNIIITGTNGKTTTSRMLAHFAKASGLKVLRNHTGSNLERGIASTLIQGHNKQFDLGIWETDEAAFNQVAPMLQPKVVVFLNVFRDQLDRYGEIDTVVKKWGETLKKLDKNTKVYINGDDANTLKLTKYFKAGIQKFGVREFKIKGEAIGDKTEKVKLDIEAKNIKLRGLSGSSFSVTIQHQASNIHLPVPGVYHIYDFLASFAVSQALGFDNKIINSSLRKFSPAFGRVEKLGFGYIFLIKNPAGATQVFETITPQFKKTDKLLLALNDKLADGTDVSWIWDAEFERLFEKKFTGEVVCSGTRAFDLANRLKYAGLEPKQIKIEEDLEKALKQARKALNGRLFILPTYTAMLQLQDILARSGVKKKYWEAEE